MSIPFPTVETTTPIVETVIASIPWWRSIPFMGSMVALATGITFFAGRYNIKKSLSEETIKLGETDKALVKANGQIEALKLDLDIAAETVQKANKQLEDRKALLASLTKLQEAVEKIPVTSA